MNNKVLAAFLGGLVIASGVTYLMMWQQAPKPAAQPVAAVAPSLPAEQPPPAAPATEVKPVEPAPVLAPPVKPSPAIRGAAKPRSVVPAPRSTPAPVASAPQPAPPATPSAPPATSEPVQTASAEPPRAVNAIAAPSLPPPPKEDPKPNTVTIPSGTTVTVRLAETLSSERSQVGDTFTATLDQPLIVDGFVIAERGSRAQGKVIQSDRAGRVKGLAQLGVELTQITTSDGQKVRVNTAAFQKQAESSRRKDAAKVGVGAAIGAAIGAIAGGGKGAGIGAGVGGAAGAGEVLISRGQAAELETETRLTFRLAQAVTVTEKLK
jgi:hypothetical protein